MKIELHWQLDITKDKNQNENENKAESEFKTGFQPNEEGEDE